MPENYEWGEAFQEKLLALYIREPQNCYVIMEPSYFTNPIFRDIARLTKEVYDQHNYREVRLSKSTLYSIVQGSLGKKRRDLWPSYHKTIKAVFADQLKDRPIIFAQALSFSKSQKFRQALVSAERDVNNQQFDSAIRRFEELKGFGQEYNLGLEYWKDASSPSRWHEDRHGVVGTFYFPKLDWLMGGGLGAGELAIILAGGKTGKTTLLGRIAAGALWQNKNVAIATGELSAAKYRKRIDAMITGIPSGELTRLALTAEAGGNPPRLVEAKDRMEQARALMKGNLWIKQYPTGKGKVNDIEGWLEQLEEQGAHIDVLFVDYVRVFRPSERFDSQRERIGQVAVELRGIATEREIPVWTASQSNRAALRKERLGPEDLAEDISQFWTLDFLIAFCQTEQEHGTEKSRKKGIPEDARLFLTSARDVGRGGIIPVKIIRDTFVIKEKEKWDGRTTK